MHRFYLSTRAPTSGPYVFIASALTQSASSPALNMLLMLPCLSIDLLKYRWLYYKPFALNSLLYYRLGLLFFFNMWICLSFISE